MMRETYRRPRTRDAIRDDIFRHSTLLRALTIPPYNKRHITGAVLWLRLLMLEFDEAHAAVNTCTTGNVPFSNIAET